MRDDLPVDTIGLARFMVGKCLMHDLPDARVSGRLVETEAYPVGDSMTSATASDISRRTRTSSKRARATRPAVPAIELRRSSSR